MQCQAVSERGSPCSLALAVPWTSPFSFQGINCLYQQDELIQWAERTKPCIKKKIVFFRVSFALEHHAVNQLILQVNKKMEKETEDLHSAFWTLLA